MDNLSKTWQLQSLSAAESHRLAEMTCLTLRGMRTEQAFDLFIQRLELHQQGMVWRRHHFLEGGRHLSDLNMEMGGL